MMFDLPVEAYPWICVLSLLGLIFIFKSNEVKEIKSDLAKLKGEDILQKWISLTRGQKKFSVIAGYVVGPLFPVALFAPQFLFNMPLPTTLNLGEALLLQFVSTTLMFFGLMVAVKLNNNGK
jgi:hypothetical protein